MDRRAKFGIGLAAVVGTCIGSAGAFSSVRLADMALNRNDTSYSRRALIAQPCGLPPYQERDADLRKIMEINSLALDELVRDWYAQANKEHVTITVDGGTIRLAGTVFHAERPSRTWVILAHSYRSTNREMDKIAFLYARRGFNVLNLDLRSHGESEGTMIGCGYQDGQDILEWVDYLVSRFGADISVVLHGQSMGGAAVLNASAWCQNTQIVAIVADSSFATMRDVSLRLMRRAIIPSVELLYFGMRLGNLVRGGFDFGKNNPVDSIADSCIPTLFIHGANDVIVPSVDATNLFHACGAQSKYLFICPRAGHRASVFVDPEGYEEAVFDFLGKVGVI